MALILCFLREAFSIHEACLADTIQDLQHNILSNFVTMWFLLSFSAMVLVHSFYVKKTLKQNKDSGEYKFCLGLLSSFNRPLSWKERNLAERKVQEGGEKKSEKASPSHETATPLTVTRTIKENCHNLNLAYVSRVLSIFRFLKWLNFFLFSNMRGRQFRSSLPLETYPASISP